MASNNDKTDLLCEKSEYEQALWEYNYAVGHLNDESTDGDRMEIKYLKDRVDHLKKEYMNKNY